ncbi:MAG TPA: geranylgeranyl reductase family protein [archaeon]|nr:geranylgeranyl reductase family protein [archaeon]
MKNFDLLIVGAGTAGCLAAKIATDHNLDVCLMDRKPSKDIGNKVCADAIGKHHFDNLKLAYPSHDELACKIAGIDVYSPNKETVFRISGEGLHGFILNRHEFGQRLLNKVLDKGITFIDNSTAFEPIIEGKFVRGVLAKNIADDIASKIYGKITIDATGYAASLRQKLPLEWGVETVKNEDVSLCYREIREIKTEIDSDYCEIYLNQIESPGGYVWIFPKGPGKVNVGLGVQMRGKYPSPKSLLYNYVLSQPLFRDSKILTGGGGQVPTRRPLSCLVANGIIFAGDAGCLVNPIHGGGIGPSMMSGKLAAEAAAEAIENGDVSREKLWQYNINYMKSYGAKQAGLDIFRLFLQGTSDDELNYGMRHRLIKEEDILKASLIGEVRLNIGEKATRAFKGLEKIGFLNRLRLTAKEMRKMKEFYQKYPASDKLEEWQEQLNQFLSKTKIELA